MNTYKILAASGISLNAVKAAFIKNAEYEADIWWATPDGARFAPQKGSIESLLHKTLRDLSLPRNTLTHEDVFAWGYKASCKCNEVQEEVRSLAAKKNEIQSQMFREMGRRNDQQRYAMLG